ncbi:MAG: hypothetical protein H0X33_11220 [Taibaiella sp.]|nr:hypothetical protein [Taibaiella sp.]
MKNILSALILFLCTATTTAIHAQSTPGKASTDKTIAAIDDATDNTSKGSYFSIGINFLSNNVYLGRKDSVVIPYISPYIGYTFKMGIYFRATMSYAASSTDPHIDLTTLEGGYQHTFWDVLTVGGAFDKYFYSTTSKSVRANIKSSLSAFALFSNDYIEPQITFTANFLKNGKTDPLLTVGLDHVFFLANDKLTIIPMIALNAGTQNYYDQYLVDRTTPKGKAKPKRVLASSSQFEVMDYEISTAIQYKTHDWVFLINPTLAIPENPSTLIRNNQPVVLENLTNTFFIEVDISHRFYSKSKK